jgi:hypothetical protein
MRPSHWGLYGSLTKGVIEMAELQYPFEYYLDQVLDGGLDRLLSWDWSKPDILPYIKWDGLRLVRLARAELVEHPVPSPEQQHEIYWKLCVLEEISRDYADYLLWSAGEDHTDDEGRTAVKALIAQGRVKVGDITLVRDYFTAIVTTSELTASAA